MSKWAAVVLSTVGLTGVGQSAMLDLPQPLRIGDPVPFTVSSPEPYGFPAAPEPRVVWSRDIVLPGATYVAPHFARFDLPPGDELVVRSPDGHRAWRYRDDGKPGLGRAGGFWGIHVSGERLTLELVSRGGPHERRDVGFAIDRVAVGFAPLAPEAVCGVDDKENARCYEATDAQAYQHGRSVARLLIEGQFLCTGWLVGSEGHLITNHHCISTEAGVDNTAYEFLAEGGCSQSCGAMACPGTIVTTTGTLIQTDETLDYTLILLSVNPTATFGFLQMRATTAVVGERIYIPQHPGGRGKEIAVLSSDPHDATGFPEIDSISAFGDQWGTYFADTEGGSSGSPVLGHGDHCVVVLHVGAAGCTEQGNLGTLTPLIVADLGANLPEQAVVSGGTCVAGSLFADGFESATTAAWSATSP